MSPNSYIGSIGIFAGGFEPKGWTFCDGKLLSITEYFTLYSIIGTAYGGDGVATFAVPDLRNAIPSGENSSRPNIGSVAFRYFSDNTDQNLAQTFLTVNYCICLEGTIPERDNG